LNFGTADFLFGGKLYPDSAMRRTMDEGRSANAVRNPDVKG
jgi:hypothetical protein